MLGTADVVSFVVDDELEIVREQLCDAVGRRYAGAVYSSAEGGIDAFVFLLQHVQKIAHRARDGLQREKAAFPSAGQGNRQPGKATVVFYLNVYQKRKTLLILNNCRC